MMWVDDVEGDQTVLRILINLRNVPTDKKKL